ncbi:MAG: DUF3280 domain-containing protein [Hyphomicrobiaceae bacterium]|nr:DUF3280 domain-containing protein [Hyphomicrobiaceae bacterium]
MRRFLALLAATLLTAAGAQAAPKAAVFPFELIDDSLDGQYLGARAEEEERLALATAELRKLVAQEAGYDVVDLGPLKSEIEKAAPLYKCNGCEVELARKAGAEFAITAAVRKYTNLLLSLHIYVTEVSTGKLTKMYRIDIRGNTDESWLRGVRWLVARGLVGS